MTKHILLALAAMASLTASAQQQFTIKGKLTGNVEGKTVIISRGNDVFGQVPVDSAVIKNGEFTLRGQVAEPSRHTIRFYKDDNRADMGSHGVVMHPAIDLLIDGGTIEVEAPVDSLPNDFNSYYKTYDYTKLTRLKGSPLLTKYVIYKQQFTDLYEQYQKVSGAFYANVSKNNGATVDESIAFVNATEKRQAKIAKAMVQQIRANADNPVGAIILNEQMGRFNAQQLDEVLALFPASVKQSSLGAPIFATADTVRGCAIGANYIDVPLQTTKGKAVKLSDYVKPGRWTLVEFWASWCGPCRGEIPHLKQVYDLYHDDGFDIVSISMDDKKDAWLKAVKEEAMA